MDIQFTGHNIEVTPALRQFTTDKFERLHRHFDKITSVHVTFDVEKLRQIAESTINLAGAQVHASAESENMYTTIDSLVDKLDRQIIKHKEKSQNHEE